MHGTECTRYLAEGTVRSVAGIIIKFQRITQLIERARHTQTTDTLAMASLWLVAHVVVCGTIPPQFLAVGSTQLTHDGWWCLVWSMGRGRWALGDSSSVARQLEQQFLGA